MNLKISKDIEVLSHDFADWLVDYIAETLSKQDRFTIALSGGSTPKNYISCLPPISIRDQIDWKRIIFFGVMNDLFLLIDDRNNAKMAFEALLDHVPWLKNRFMSWKRRLIRRSPRHRMRKHYMIILITNPIHSILYFGLGDNAHTLSLFPGYEVVKENKKWVSAFYLKEQEMYRITLTAPVVNQACQGSFPSKRG